MTQRGPPPTVGVADCYANLLVLNSSLQLLVTGALPYSRVCGWRLGSRLVRYRSLASPPSSTAPLTASAAQAFDSAGSFKSLGR